jgi:hypothetical protein
MKITMSAIDSLSLRLLDAGALTFASWSTTVLHMPDVKSGIGPCQPVCHNSA